MMRDLAVPVLTPLAYFVVNPKVANEDVQYTVDEILQKIMANRLVSTYGTNHATTASRSNPGPA